MGSAYRTGITLFVIGICLITSPSYASPSTKVYSFGVVPQFEQRKIFRIWQPIIDELETRTGLRFKIKGSQKIPVFEKSFLGGEFDFAYMNPYHINLANQSQGYIPLIRDAERSLRGIIVVRRDSQLSHIKQLDGERVAFPAPNALGASLLIRSDFAQQHHIGITPFYVQTHSSVYLHVVKGLATAGGGVRGTLMSQPPEIRNKLQVLYETRPIPPHPIAAHPRVTQEHRERVTNALIAIANTEKGKALLAKVPIGNAIKTDIGDYAIIRKWQLEKYYVAQ